ncbi:YggT family protein [Candidatus Latescibacterota bacterium]
MWIILFEGFGMAVRLCTAAIALLLIVQSILTKYFPSLIRNTNINKTLFSLTNMIVTPARKILPWSINNKRVDYSPLITAVLLLILGLGVQTVCTFIGDILLEY